ncbi:MAG: hypothetical protein DRJ40_00495 [Thermoprotei archaeon]|nr:MAG: hypothetical protein DRJ40_00495 [Thermoprotei archaeon]
MSFSIRLRRNPGKKQQPRKILISSHRVTNVRNVLLRIKRNYRCKGFLEVPRVPEDRYEIPKR